MDQQEILITLIGVDLTLEDMLKAVSLLVWIFCYNNLSNKLLESLLSFFFFIQAIIFFPCSIIEEGHLTRCISEGYLQ